MGKKAKKIRTLLLDNYDSFTYNLYQYLGELGGNPIVVKNNAMTLDQIRELAPSHIVISPGPGSPENPGDFGVCSEVILTLGKTTPLLGICLGHQGIVQAFGGKVIPAPTVMHGKKSTIRHDQNGVFKGIPSPLSVMRYHSLMADPKTLPNSLVVTAETPKKVIMGVRHRQLPIEGVQFHPESIGTNHGKTLIKNFLEQKGF